jgi:hypothetical protein
MTSDFHRKSVYRIYRLGLPSNSAFSRNSASYKSGTNRSLPPVALTNLGWLNTRTVIPSHPLSRWRSAPPPARGRDSLGLATCRLAGLVWGLILSHASRWPTHPHQFRLGPKGPSLPILSRQGRGGSACQQWPTAILRTIPGTQYLIERPILIPPNAPPTHPGPASHWRSSGTPPAKHNPQAA